MRRFFCYLVLILVMFFLQNNIFAASSLVVTVPNLLLILTFSFGFIRGSTEGMLIGFVCGLLNDVFFSETLGLSAMVYTVLGYSMGLLGRIYYTEFVSMPIVLCVISDLLYHLGTFVLAFALRGQLRFDVYFRDIVLPELLYTAVLTLLLYPLFGRINGWIESWEKRRTKSFV